MSQTFTMTRRVQFAETDMAGVLHFANYFRIMEETEHAFWRSLGRSVIVSGDGRHISWPRVNAECDYKAPARFEDELTIALQLVRIGGKSLQFELRFERAGEHLATGHFTTVCCEIDPTAGGFEVIPIPGDIRKTLEPYVKN